MEMQKWTDVSGTDMAIFAKPPAIGAGARTAGPGTNTPAGERSLPAPYTVSMLGGVAVHALQFIYSGYTIGGTGSLSLAGNAPITLADGTVLAGGEAKSFSQPIITGTALTGAGTVDGRHDRLRHHRQR